MTRANDCANVLPAKGGFSGPLVAMAMKKLFAIDLAQEFHVASQLVMRHCF